VHTLSRGLSEALDNQDKLEKEFLMQAAKRVKNHPTTDKAGQLSRIKSNLEKEMAELRDMVAQQISEIGTIYEEIKGWKTTVTELSKRLKDLESEDPTALKAFREGLKASMLYTSIFDGNKVATDITNIGTGLISASVLYGYDKIASKALDGTIFDAA
jgi:hypothetical protein